MFGDEANSARTCDDVVRGEYTDPSNPATATAVSPLLAMDEATANRHNHHADTELQYGNDRNLVPPIRGRKPTTVSHSNNSAATSPFDLESGDDGGLVAVDTSKLRTTVARPRRSVVLARPMPFEPITDPFAWVCDIARRPKFGHQYVLCPGRSSLSRRRRNNNRVGLSVGPHWSGVIYTMSIVGVVTLFLTRFIMKGLAPWYQPVTVICSLITLGFLLATAIADPGIVVESGEAVAGAPFCEVCSIWRPEDAEHCEEW